MKQKFSMKNSEKKTRISRKLFFFNQLTIISQTKKLSVILFPCDKYIKWNFLFMLSPSFIIFCQMLWNLWHITNFSNLTIFVELLSIIKMYLLPQLTAFLHSRLFQSQGQPKLRFFFLTKRRSVENRKSCPDDHLLQIAFSANHWPSHCRYSESSSIAPQENV